MRETSPPQAAFDPADVLGGPLFQLLRKRPSPCTPPQLLRRRIIALVLIAWLPLFLLAALDGQLLDRSDGIPFLLDATIHARLLVAIPLLVVAELAVYKPLNLIVREFQQRDLVPDAGKAQFEAALATAARWRNSLPVELAMIIIVYAWIYFFVMPQYDSLHFNSWNGRATPEGTRLSLAGMWNLFVAMPLFQFLLLRWYFRMLLWARFLRSVSKVDLRLVPAHPDRVGGLGFLAHCGTALLPLAAAHGVLVSGMLANRIFHAGMTLPQFKAEIVAVVAVVLLLAFGPLLFFLGSIARARREGLLDFDRLAQRYVHEFQAKWLSGTQPKDEALVGSADIQSLADLASSSEIVRDMHMLPVTLRGMAVVAVVTLLPVAPLLLTVMPAEQLLKMLLGVLV